MKRKKVLLVKIFSHDCYLNKYCIRWTKTMLVQTADNFL